MVFLVGIGGAAETRSGLQLREQLATAAWETPGASCSRLWQVRRDSDCQILAPSLSSFSNTAGAAPWELPHPWACEGRPGWHGCGGRAKTSPALGVTLCHRAVPSRSHTGPSISSCPAEQRQAQAAQKPQRVAVIPVQPHTANPLHAFSCKLRNHKHPGKTWQQIPPSPSRFFFGFFFHPGRSLEGALVLMDLSLPHQKLDEW